MTTRLQYITIVSNRLGLLATTAGLTLGEADYGEALDAAFRALTGSTDLPDDDDVVVNDVIDMFEMFVLKQLRNYYTFYVDTSVGPRKQSFSQLLDRIEKRIRDAAVSVANTTDFGTLNAYDSSTPTWPVNWFELGYEQVW